MPLGVRGNNTRSRLPLTAMAHHYCDAYVAAGRNQTALLERKIWGIADRAPELGLAMKVQHKVLTPMPGRPRASGVDNPRMDAHGAEASDTSERLAAGRACRSSVRRWRV